MENQLFHNLMTGYRILFLALLGQTGLMVFCNWIRKTVYLIRKDFMKFTCLTLAVAANFFMYSYFFTEFELFEVLQSSLFFVPVTVFMIIDFCVQM